MVAHVVVWEVLLIVGLAYAIILIRVRGGTIGMAVMGVEAVDQTTRTSALEGGSQYSAPSPGLPS